VAIPHPKLETGLRCKSFVLFVEIDLKKPPQRSKGCAKHTGQPGIQLTSDLFYR
jgi:hypothetical protein